MVKNTYSFFLNFNFHVADECKKENGGCDQVCINSEGQVQCGCNPGYVLDHTDNR